MKGYCDIKINLDSISVTTKLKRKEALAYDYNRLRAYHFEVYGVEDYLSDFYHEGMTIQELLDKLQASHEQEIAFSFRFSYDTSGDAIFAFAKQLRREGFHY